MTPEFWQQIGDIIEQALGVQENEREAFIIRACHGDDELESEVRDLLKVASTDPDYLEDTSFPRPELPAGEELPDETNIGPYKIIRPLGQGGMGQVFLAQKEDASIGTPLALKLVKAGLDSDAILHRFEMEQQILAQLIHPNIARLMDAGKTASGRPYFVMEYVDGIPITDYCDQRQLGIDERLALFYQVCNAVQFAHQHLVVHRDLKPSNLLVRSGSNDKPEVMLLDFGIAKALSPWQPGVTAIQTRTNFRILTPAYASPEQVRGENITTASDIYSLGILLYELLTGKRPYSLGGKIEAEVIRIISESEPTKPSTAVFTKGEKIEENGQTVILNPESLSLARSSSEQGLHKRLKGELDNIVLMSLRKEPERRYRSAADLGADIDRHLKGLPVNAQPDTFSYRVKKFTARNRWQSFAVASFLVLLFGASGALFLQNQDIKKARAFSDAEAEKSEKVLQAMTDLFLTADGGTVPGGDTLRVRDFLLAAEPRMIGALEDDPEVKSRIREIFGHTYASQGDIERALDRFRKALNINIELNGKDDLRSISLLGSVAGSLGALAKPDSALVLYEETAERYRNHPEDTRRKLSGTLRAAFGHIPSNERERKYKMLEEAHELIKSLDDVEAVERASIANQLGVFHFNYGDFSRSLPFFEESLRNLESQYKPSDYRILVTKGNLASLYEKLDRLDDAEQHHAEVLEQRLKSYAINPEGHYKGVRFTLAQLGRVYFSKGESEKAIEYFERANQVSLDANDTAASTRFTPHILKVLVAEMRFDEAEPIFRKLSENYRDSDQFGTFEWCYNKFLRADMRRKQGRLQEALELSDEAINTMISLDIRKNGLAQMRVVRAKILIEMDRLDEAIQDLDQALQHLLSRKEPDNRALAYTEFWYGEALRQSGQLDEASDYFKKSIPRVKDLPYLSRPEKDILKRELGK